MEVCQHSACSLTVIVLTLWATVLLLWCPPFLKLFSLFLAYVISQPTLTVALDISKTLESVTKPRFLSYPHTVSVLLSVISTQVRGHSFAAVVNDHWSSHKSINSCVLPSTFFPLLQNDLLNQTFVLSIYTDDTSLHFSKSLIVSKRPALQKLNSSRLGVPECRTSDLSKCLHSGRAIVEMFNA